MNFPILVLCFAILVHSFDTTVAQSDFWGQICSDSENYTKNSAYKRNLDDVLYTLTETNNGFGFFNSTSGQAKATALCRGDIVPATCRRCVDDATRRLRQVCPNQVQARGWYDRCFLKYSNGTFDDFRYVYEFNLSSASNISYDQWNQSLANLLGVLRPEAVGGGQFRKYTSGNKSAGGFVTIFGMMQCIPYLSATECDNCLAEAINIINTHISDKSVGVRIYLPDCFIRYELFRFFNSTWFPASPAPTPTVSPSSKSTSIAVIVGPILAVVVVIFVVVVFIILRRRQKQMTQEVQVRFNDSLPEGITLQREDGDAGEMSYFSLRTIQDATNNFSLENMLGEGGFGPVYKGTLQDGTDIAVKRLSTKSRQGIEEFETEVQVIVKVQHKNLVRLLGYCVEGSERILIYEFMANNSLDTILFYANKCEELDWETRTKIVIGIAKGLRYLHEDSRLKIVHRDMKASNILLDDEKNPKFSDFGTARIFGGDQIEAATNQIIGSFGYMAPEYAMGGLFSIKSDIYSFGVLLLEIVVGQQNTEFSYQGRPQNFLSTALQLWKENKGEELIDSRTIHTFPTHEALRWINIALLCVQVDPDHRPTMSAVVAMLEGQWTANLPVPSGPPVLGARFAAVVSEQTTIMGDQTDQHLSASVASSSTA